MLSSCWYISLLKCTGSGCLFKQEQENKFQGNIFNLSQKFCLILPQNKQFNLDFRKSSNKNCKCGNLWQKMKCARAMGSKLVFLFWPYKDYDIIGLDANQPFLYAEVLSQTVM